MGKMMHFDHYQATIPDDHREVISALRSDLREAIVETETGNGRHGYDQTIRFRDAEGARVFEVQAGGMHDRPNVTSSSIYAERLSEAVRRRWKAHRVTRVDVAHDVVQRGAYELLEGVCRDVARRHRLKGMTISHDDPSQGRTYYLGATSSPIRLRLYDKTAEQRATLPTSTRPTVPDHWTRLELQVRPRKHQKDQAATMPPGSFWGWTRWTRSLANEALMLDVEKRKPDPTWRGDPDRALRFMAKQYGRILTAGVEQHGSWEELGLRLAELVAEETGQS